MAKLEVVMMEVLVEICDWAMCPEVKVDSGEMICSAYKVPTGSMPTEVKTEVVTFVVSARQPLA
jgi:hypothetical protein